MDNQSTMIYLAEKKSMGVAYLLCLFLGGLGAHRFYMKSYIMGCVQLGLVLAAIIFAFVGYGIIFGLITAFIAIIDLFLIPSIIKKYNYSLMSKIQNNSVITP